MVLSGPAGAGIKGQEELHGLIGIEKPEFLPDFPKLGMEPVSFRGIEMDFGFGEKVLVIMGFKEFPRPLYKHNGGETQQAFSCLVCALSEAKGMIKNMSEKFQEKKRFVRYKEGAKLYSLCQSTFEKRAKEAGATYKVGKAVLVDCEIFEKYLESFCIPAE